MLVAGVLITSGPGSAHNEPAGDALATRMTFISPDASASSADRRRLEVIVQRARDRGYPLKVAVIASPQDLGEAYRFWRQPQRYARSLAKELGWTRPLLVAMPNGFGVAHGSAAASSAPTRDLVDATVFAVARLAAEAGHPVAVPAAVEQTARSSRGRDRIMIIVAAAVLFTLLLAVRRTSWPPNRGARS